MKTRFFRFLGIAIVMVAFSASAFGQVSATAAAAARIIAPITIVNTADLHFGTIIRAAGTVTVSPAGVRTASGPGLSALAPASSAAAFTVAGEPNLTYSITLPSVAVVITDGTNNMNVTAFTSSPTPTGTLSAGGSQALTVGATLTVGAAQPSGTYTTGASPFTVTVNYN